jgi:hypothetical protein
MAFDLPTIALLAVSVTVIVWAPGVFKVIEKAPAPTESLASDGRIELSSLLAKCTVPA